MVFSLLLPLPAGTTATPEVPAGHWSYAALRDLAAAGLFRPYTEKVDTYRLRSRFEMALLIRKASSVLDALVDASPAPDIPGPTRIDLRLQGLRRQLDSLAVIRDKLSRNYAWSSKLGGAAYLRQPVDMLVDQLPALQQELAGLQKEYRQAAAKTPEPPAATWDEADWKRLESRLDQLLAKVVSMHVQVAELAPVEYLALTAPADDLPVQALRAYAQAADAKQADKLAQAAITRLKALEREFSGELAALRPQTGAGLPAGGSGAGVNGQAGNPLNVTGSALTNLAGTSITGAIDQAIADGVPAAARFDQRLDLQAGVELPDGSSLLAGLSGRNDLLARPEQAISIDDLTLRMKNDVVDAEAGANLTELTLTPLTLRSQNLAGARTRFSTGRTSGTFLVGKTKGFKSTYLAALNSRFQVTDQLEVGATVVSNLGATLAGTASASGLDGKDGAGLLDTSIQAQWRPSEHLALFSEMAFSAVDKMIDQNNKAFRLTGLTDLFGINLVTRLHRVEAGFNPRFAAPSEDAYLADSTGYSLEASSALGPLQLRAGIGESSDLDGTNATQTRKIGAEYGFAIYGAQLQARVEMVDIDHLRDVAGTGANQAGNSGTYSGRESVAKLGLDGSVALGETGSLRVGYELAQNAASNARSFTTSAGLEYSLNDKTRLQADLSYDANQDGTRAVTDFSLGYDLTKDTSLMAGYKLINFNDVTQGDYSANVAQARLSVRF